MRRACRLLPGVAAEWIDDSVQELLVTLILAESRGELIEDPVAFGATFFRRRYADELRRQRTRPTRSTRDLDREEREPPPRAVDWAARLRQEGLPPTEKWSAILRHIESGTRSARGIADGLGCDESTVRENRRRLQRWLREVVLFVLRPPRSDDQEDEGS